MKGYKWPWLALFLLLQISQIPMPTCSLLFGSEKVVPDYERGATSAKCNGVTDDTLAIQADINGIAAQGGQIVFPAGRTCKVFGTVSAAVVNNIALLGYGTTLSGGSGPIFDLGDRSGKTPSKNVQIIGFKVTNGAWPSGFYRAGQSSADAIVLHSCQLCEIDVIGENVGGSVVRFAGQQPILGTRSSIRVQAMDVGYGVYLLHASHVVVQNVVRRAHINGAYVNDVGQCTLSLNVDETLQPPNPVGNQGVGILLNDVAWCQITGVSTAARLSALLLEGHSNWNTIMGIFNDSSTLADGATSNIVIQGNGGSYIPEHNLFLVSAGYTGIVSSNRPAYGIDELDGAHNQVIGIEADGARDGAVRGSLRILGDSVPPPPSN